MPVLGPTDLTRRLRECPETRLLDVRTPSEFDTQHIAGACNDVDTAVRVASARMAAGGRGRALARPTARATS